MSRTQWQLSGESWGGTQTSQPGFSQYQNQVVWRCFFEGLSTNLVSVWASRALVTPRDLVPTRAWHKIPKQMTDVLNTTAEVLKRCQSKSSVFGNCGWWGSLLEEGTSRLDSEDWIRSSFSSKGRPRIKHVKRSWAIQQESYKTVRCSLCTKGQQGVVWDEIGDASWVKIMISLIKSC